MKNQYLGILFSLLCISCGQIVEDKIADSFPDDTSHLNWRIASTNQIELKNLKYLQTTLNYEEGLKIVTEDLKMLEQFDAKIQDIVNQPRENTELKEIYRELKQYWEDLPDRYIGSGYPQFQAIYPRIQENPNNLIYEILELERQIITFLSNQMLALLLRELDKGVFPVIHSERMGVNNDSVKHTIVLAREIGRVPTILELNRDSLTENKSWQSKSMTTLFSKKNELKTLLIKIPAMTSKEGATLIEMEIEK